MDIKRVRPGDVETLRAVWELVTAARAVDLPVLPPDPVEEILNDPTALRTEARERWIAYDRGRAVGALRLRLPQIDNTHVASLSIVVHPDVRRQGFGRALFDLAWRRAREEARTTLTAELGEPLGAGTAVAPHVSPGAAFAATMGARPALAETVRVLDVERLDGDRLDALAAEASARSVGYELVQWVGPAPDDVVGDLAWLSSRMSTDAPMGDLLREEEAWDAERFRESEAEAAVVGRRWVTTAARHVESGRAVAFTDIGFPTSDPRNSFQWTTIVDSAHRGHRLGMLVKVGNFRLLRQEQPAAERIFAWNADSNEHMIAINNAMGFRPVATSTEWQLDLS